MAVLALLAAIVCWLIEGFEVVGNYKFWDSLSNEIIYDHSGFQNHGGYSSQSFYYTDRGIMIHNACVLEFPSKSIKEYPGYSDFTVSYWYLNKLYTYSRLFAMNHVDQNIKIFLEVSNVVQSYITANLLEHNYIGNFTLPTPYSVNNWRLHTFKVSYNSFNTNPTISIYIDLSFITSFTAIGGNLTSQSQIGIGGFSFLYGIVYEIWWHKDVSNIQELGYLIGSSSSCMCSYGCVTTPTTKCLNIYDSNHNSQDETCSRGCPYSCDSEHKCIESYKAECKSSLYHIDSGNCLIYCPDDSCIFISLLEWSCKVGYKKVSDNPPACIQSQCISYARKDYEYICYICESGYIPDSLGRSCVCDVGFYAVAKDPLVCMKNPNCLEYMQEGDKYICLSCSEGYMTDLNGNCNGCDIGYSIVSDIPFICVATVENCAKYRLNGKAWECEICDGGYPPESSNLCKDPDIAIESCEKGSYLSDGECAKCPVTCAACVEFNDRIDCNECKENYTALIIDNERVCIFCSKDNPICNLEEDGSDQSESENSLEDNTGSTDLNNTDEEKEESSISSDNFLVSQAGWIFLAIAIASSIVSVLSTNSNSFFAMLGTTELLSFILMYNLDIPDRARAVMEGMDILRILPNIFEYFISTNKKLHEARYNRTGYESEYFLINSGKFITLFVSMMLIYIIFKLLSKLLNKISNLEALLNRIVRSLEWNLIIDYSMQMQLEITITSLLNIVNYSYRDAYSAINLLISIIVMVIDI